MVEEAVRGVAAEVAEDEVAAHEATGARGGAMMVA
jgi:hypothetical protein